MSRLTRFALVGVVLAAGAAVAQAPDLSHLDIVERSIPDGPVALVDGKPVPHTDLLYLYRTQIGALAASLRDREVDDAMRVKTGLRCLGELVQREILYQESQRRGIALTEEEIEQAYSKRLERLQAGVKTRDGAPLTEERILSKSGQTRAEAKEELRKSVLVGRVWEAIGKEKAAAVSEKDIKAFYDEHPKLFQRSGGIHLKQIFIAPKPNARDADEDAWAKEEKAMKKALARIHAGESFEKVAKGVSEAPGREDGGDLGLRPASALPEFLRVAAEALEPGSVSGVIRSQHGFHLVKLVGTDEESTVSLAEASERIEALLREQKTEQTVAEFCQPIVGDPGRVKFFVHLERTLAAMAAGSEN